MKYSSLLLPLIFAGCGSRHFFKRTPDPNVDPPPLPPQPPIVDPIDLIIDGNNTGKLSEQTHVTPFLTIVIVTLLICFIPYGYVKLKPHFINSLPKLKRLKEWTGEKLVEGKDWVKKKLDKKKE